MANPASGPGVGAPGAAGSGDSRQHQHVISAWLLKAFGRREAGHWALTAYDKATGTYGPHAAADFLVELDAHSSEIETEIGRIEGPAADAARRLRKRAVAMSPGFYAVVEADSSVQASGPAFSDKGVVEGMRLFVSEHTVGGFSQADRLALGRYAGLMYQRAPKTETAILRWGVAYDAASRAEIERIWPGLGATTFTTLAHRRERMVGMARRIGDRLAASNWWVLRADDGEGFVLGDTPVVATIALGHDTAWRAIFADDAYTVVMPIGPSVALVIATKHIVPVSGVEDAAGLGRAINRLIWRSADRYVLAESRAELEAAMPGADEDTRRYSVEVEHDAATIVSNATAIARRIAVDAYVKHRLMLPLEAVWQRWTDCSLEFGFVPFAPEDRGFFVGGDAQGPGLAPPCGPFGSETSSRSAAAGPGRPARNARTVIGRAGPEPGRRRE